MFGRMLRWLVMAGALGGAAWWIAKFLRGDPVPAFESGPAPLPPTRPAQPTIQAKPRPVVAPKPAPAPEPAGPETVVSSDGQWMAAVAGEDGPASHPVKAKLKSGIYHLPGMLNYDRTIPDRWYSTAESAEADGLRKAKR